MGRLFGAANFCVADQLGVTVQRLRRRGGSTRSSASYFNLASRERTFANGSSIPGRIAKTLIADSCREQPGGTQ